MTKRHMAKSRVKKNYEFYTQYKDVVKELVRYPDEFFEGRRVLLPADGRQSAFFRYFEENFDRLGLEEVVATCYNEGGKGRYHHLDKRGVKIGFLKGDGDFRGFDVSAFRDDADIIVTNPPFSLLREFYDWIGDKDFILLANLNCLTYNNISKGVAKSRVRAGFTFNKKMEFDTPDGK